MAKQKLCPYTGTALGTEGKTNKEHVTPVAIGAPAKFFVEAHESSNSFWNDRIDAPFSNDKAVRLLATANRVRSRSGDVTSRLDGIISETGDSVKLELSKDGIDIKFTQPVSKDSHGYMVKGYGDRAYKEVEKLKQNLQNKGISVDIGQHRSILKPTVSSSFDVDSKLVTEQLIKTAYLYTVWCLGDKAISSKNRSTYIDGLHGKEMISANISLSENLPGSHQFTLLTIGEKAFCEVSLFGVFKGLFVTEVDMPVEAFAQYSHIDLKKNQITEKQGLHDLHGLLLKLVKQISS